MEFQRYCDDRYRCQSLGASEERSTDSAGFLCPQRKFPRKCSDCGLAKQLVDDLYQITITCAAQGKLAQQAQGDEKNLLLLQPEASNDAGFAMTSSFSSMMLTALLVFDRVELVQKEAKVAALIQLSQDVLERVADCAAAG